MTQYKKECIYDTSEIACDLSNKNATLDFLYKTRLPFPQLTPWAGRIEGGPSTTNSFNNQGTQ
jgi:hypothetical protein